MRIALALVLCMALASCATSSKPPPTTVLVYFPANSAILLPNAARALKRENDLGKLAPGAFADLIALPFEGAHENVCEAIVQNRKPIEWMMVDGKILA